MSAWIKKQKSLLRIHGDVICEEHVVLTQPDNGVALESFRNHWKQAWAIMCRTMTQDLPESEISFAEDALTMSPTNGLSSEPASLRSNASSGNASEQIEVNCHTSAITAPVITADEVTTIVNHIEQMISLLLQEYQTRMQRPSTQNDVVVDAAFESTPINMSPLLDYLLMESILDKLFSWSSTLGEFTNVMKLEQLKLYELLVSELCHQSILFQTALIRPLLHLLSTCKDCAPLEVEKRLVGLLNTLCLFLSQNPELLELFFVGDAGHPNNVARSMEQVKSSPQLKGRLSYLDNPESRFLVFSLLISFVHRDGAIGQQAREALLLIMSLSRKHKAIGEYIAENSNFCPVLATGLSGLYSLLPRKLCKQVMQADDWHQLTAEDVHEIVELQNFLTSLQFCNAVVQVSHPMVKQQLLEYISQGFLVSVIGPALHQNTIEEIIATTAYLELCIRTIGEPDLLQVFLRFVCMEKFDEQRILDTLISRITCNKKLGLVTIVLFRTLLELNCEDILHELVLKHLITFAFLADRSSAQLYLVNDTSGLDWSARKLLSYLPCVYTSTKTQLVMNSAPAQLCPADLERLEAMQSLTDPDPLSSLHSEPDSQAFQLLLANQKMMHNYVDYLNDAHRQIKRCATACSTWSEMYAASESTERNCHSDINTFLHQSHQDVTNELGTEETSNAVANAERRVAEEADRQSAALSCTEDYFDRDCTFEQELIGPFLSALFNRLEMFYRNDVCTNLQLTGLIARLLAYSQPALRAFFFSDRLAVHPRIRTLWRVLSRNKRRLEHMSRNLSDFERLSEKAKEYFAIREKTLMNENGYLLDRSICLEAEEGKRSRGSPLPSEQIMIHVEPNRESKRNTLLNFWNKLRSDKSSNNNVSTNNNNSFVKEEMEYSNNRKSSNISRISGRSEINQPVISEKQQFALCVFIYQEFVKEVSALCQEHYILDQQSDELQSNVTSSQYKSTQDLSSL